MGARKWVAGLLSVTLVTCPAAATEVARPVGLVMASHKANLDGADPLQGATVFAPQNFFTQSGGGLRIRLEQAQLTLSAESAGRIDLRDGRLQTTLVRGAMRMEWRGASPVELSALGVTIRPQGSAPADAEVAVTGPGEIVVTSHAGELIATYEDTTQVIPARASYRAVLTPEAEPQGTQGAGRRRPRRAAAIWWIAGGAAAGVSLWLWLKDRRESVSPTIP